MASDQASTKIKSADSKIQDLEVKDAHIIFNSVWASLEDELGEENLRFPKEIFWLNGAPGAGKGTNTDFIMQYRDLTAPPLVVSGLLKSPEAQKMKDAGMLVGDREVIERSCCVNFSTPSTRPVQSSMVSRAPRSRLSALSSFIKS